ncbi:unnamed protein product [Arabidopsis halleri]
MASLRKRKRSKRAFYVFGNQSKRALKWIKRRKVNDDVDINNGDHATKNTNIIDDLPETLLLVEIFSKISNPRDLIVCKSVSKRWNSLLSSSSFHYTRSLALVLNNTQPQLATNDICLESWKGFELYNYIDLDFDHPLCVLASYKDVLLCMKSPPVTRLRRSQSQFYLVNPVTMQWTRLPKFANGIIDVIPTFPLGLTGNGSKGTYYVVMLNFSKPYLLNVCVFDSKLGKWIYNFIEHPRLSPSGWCPTQYQALTFNGALHWLAEDGPIVAYNPNHMRKCIFIHRSQEMHHAFYGGGAVVSETLTVSMGHLRIIQFVCFKYPDDHHHLCIWTLVDYKQSIWKQEHEPVYFRDMVSDLPWIQDYMRGYNLNTTTNQDNVPIIMQYVDLDDYLDVEYQPPETKERIVCTRPLVCHPNNPLLVYLYLPGSIVSLDVTTKELRLITRDNGSGMSSTRSYWNHYDKVIPMTLHLDPTLIPCHEHVLLPRT